MRNRLSPEFLAWLRLRPGPAIMLPGGGAAADAVRAWQSTHGFDDLAAHWLAVRSLSLTAAVWGQLLNAPVAVSFAECRSISAAGAAVVILDPGSELLQDPAALPNEWSVTSDSIAAWASKRLNATRLTLCKSVGPPASLAEAVTRGWLDPVFPAAAAGLSVAWLNARGDSLEPCLLSA